MVTKKSKKSRLSPNLVNQANRVGGGWINADPERIRFQHSKIRPYFSGCGRSVVETFESIQNGEMDPADLPPIQVIVGPDEQDGKGPWYFSLNNRRLWVLKRCREEGLLKNNVVRVRVRAPKSHVEFERYTIENCALQASFKREKPPLTGITEGVKNIKTDDDSKKKKNTAAEKESDKSESEAEAEEEPPKDNASETSESNEEEEQESEHESSSEDEAPAVPYRNPFDLGDSSDSDSDSD